MELEALIAASIIVIAFGTTRVKRSPKGINATGHPPKPPKPKKPKKQRPKRPTRPGTRTN